MIVTRSNDKHHVYFTELRPTHTLQIFAWKQAEIHHRRQYDPEANKIIGPYTLPSNWEPT